MLFRCILYYPPPWPLLKKINKAPLIPLPMLSTPCISIRLYLSFLLFPWTSLPMSCHGGVCSFCGGTGAKVKSVVTELQSQTKLRLVSYILVSLNVVSELQTLRLVFSIIFFFFYTAGLPQEDEAFHKRMRSLWFCLSCWKCMEMGCVFGKRCYCSYLSLLFVFDDY